MAKYLKLLEQFNEALEAVTKKVQINIMEGDFNTLKQSHYKLCFAKKVGDGDFNVVWQSYTDYLMYDNLSWTPQYSVFGSNNFESNVKVLANTNTVNIKLGETTVLSEAGVFQPPYTAGPPTGFTINNKYGKIHPGVNQISTGIHGETVSTPIYVAENPIVLGTDLLVPKEFVLVWFEQNIETSTMFSTARSKSVEIDMTSTNEATRLYKDGNWSTPS